MKILLLGSQHGNELLGEKLFRNIQLKYPDILSYVEYKLANPKARKLGIRYIDSDMNRSFDCSDNSSYEVLRANKIRRYITTHDFNLVLDLHTTQCIQPPSIIVQDLNRENHSFIKASHIKHIVLMHHRSLVAHSLIGVCEQAVSIEVHNSDIKMVLDPLAEDIRRYIRDQKHHIKKEYFVVESLIYKSDLTNNEASLLVNFQRSQLGYYPILTGDNSYKKNTEYLGFKGEKVSYNEYND